MAKTKFVFATAKTQKPATTTQETAITTIEATATEIAVLPINTDVQTAFTEFKARQGIAATIDALTKVKDGFVSVWKEEKEHEYGRSFFEWLWSIFTVIALPLFSLGWLAINKGYVWMRKPETRAKASAKWQSVKNWAAPKFDYETEADRNSELTLND